jgi:peroxiredoxin (alkyl hydroperoxide reductase subunit C)
MLGIGRIFPKFNLKGVSEKNTSGQIDFPDYSNDLYKGKWLIVFFWPKDFTFVCPTEIIEFSHLNKKFTERNAQLLGVSTDSEFVHLAWKGQHPGLRNLTFPILSDIKRDLSSALGIIDSDAGVSQRATYIVDPEGIIRFVMVTDLSVGRNVNEVLRVLDALQTNELCPCNWTKGEETIKI